MEIQQNRKIVRLPVCKVELVPQLGPLPLDQVEEVAGGAGAGAFGCGGAGAGAPLLLGHIHFGGGGGGGGVVTRSHYVHSEKRLNSLVSHNFKFHFPCSYVSEHLLSYEH